MPPEPDEQPSGDFGEPQAWEPNLPREFHSEYLSGPFVRCVDCECELLDAGEVYSVVKSYVGREAVFEMAICAACSARLGATYSDHSKAAFEKSVRQWHHESSSGNHATDAEAHSPRDELLGWAAPGDVAQLDACAACGRSRAECRRYSIVGTFLGRSLVTPTQLPFRLPLLICDDCNSRTAESISRQTRDSWDRFVEEHFDGPPGVELDSPHLDPILI